MTKDVLEQLHAELDSVATGLSDAEQEALLREVQALIQAALAENTAVDETHQASLTQRFEATAAQFGAEHPTLAESLVFAINSLNNAGL